MDFGEEEIPTGYRFNPTDRQLIECYLTPKVLGEDMGFCSWFLFEKDLYEGYSNPLVLFDEINQTYDKRYFCDDKEKGDQIRYFFTPINRISKTAGKNVKRATRDGTWDGDGSKKIEQPGTNTSIGTNKSYKFSWKNGDSEYARRGKQSSWIMHEISLPQAFYDSHGMKEKFVLCWIKRRGGAHADDQILPQQPPFPVPQPSTRTLFSPSIDAHQVPRKRQRFEEPDAAIRDASSSGIQEDMLSTNHQNDLPTSSSAELLIQEEDSLSEFAGVLETESEVSNDEPKSYSELGEDNYASEAMKTYVPVPAPTTMFTPSLDAIPTQKPCYVNGPYMSSPLWVQTPSATSIAPEVTLVQPSYINLQSSTSELPMIMDDIESLLQAPSTEIFSSTYTDDVQREDKLNDEFALPLEADLEVINDERMMISEPGKDNLSREAMETCVPASTKNVSDNIFEDLLIGMVEDFDDIDYINWDEVLHTTSKDSSTLSVQDTVLATNQQEDLSGLLQEQNNFVESAGAYLNGNNGDVQQKEDNYWMMLLDYSRQLSQPVTLF